MAEAAERRHSTIPVEIENDTVYYDITEEQYNHMKENKNQRFFNFVRTGEQEVAVLRIDIPGDLAMKKSNPFKRGALQIKGSPRPTCTDGLYSYKVNLKIVNRDIGLTLEDIFIN